MKKILAISHVPWDSNYGSGTSFRLHWKVLQSKLIEGRLSVSLFTRVGFVGLLFGSRHEFVDPHYFHATGKLVLALDNNYDYQSIKGGNLKLYLRRAISRTVNIIIENFSLLYMIVYCKVHNFDILHFNSHVLISFASKIVRLMGSSRPKVIMHVRDFVAKDLSPKEKKYFSSVDVFICIDYSTYDRLIKEIDLSLYQKALVIQNPFYSVDRNCKFDFRKHDVNIGARIFAIVGPVIADKGVVNICRAFLKANVCNSVLVVLGRGDDVEKVVKICNVSNGRIVYLEEIPRLVETGFYNSIDVLIRGDSSFRTGRTVYEALYAGKLVILPGDLNNLESDKKLKEFKGKVFFYNPLSEVSLIKILNSLLPIYSRFEVQDLSLSINNLDEYRTSILDVYDTDS